MRTLPELRQEIDAIDHELLALFCARMDLSREVAEVKRRESLPVLHTGREEEILAWVTEAAGGYGEEARLLFSTMMDISRSLQQSILAGGTALKALLSTAGQDLPATGGRIACQGVSGSYSEMAARALFPDGSLLFNESFEEVFSALAKDEADYGVLPLENSSAGSVTDVFDLILKYRYYIAGSVYIPVHHCFAAQQGASLASIKKVFSHPQALAQCSEFVAENGLCAVPFSNTAAAAQLVAEGEPDAAAICSLEAAGQYGLEVLKEDIQDISGNCTRFIVLARKLCIPEHADKISLCFSLPHTTGSLFRTLARFALNGLNLTKLESRPLPDRSFEYQFYLDFTGNVREEKVEKLLCALSEELPRFALLGNYTELWANQ